MNRPLAAVIAALLLVGLGCEPLAVNPAAQRRSYPVRAKPNPTLPSDAPTRLKVMTWNIKYGAGRIDFWFDLWGDRVQMTASEVDGNLDGIYRLINEVQPDVLLTNEIEVGSRRSAYVDMVAGILENTGLNYAGYVPNWQSRYVPSEGLGRVDMGNAIFSRYPIRSVEGIPQAQRTDQDVLTDTFSLHRTLGRAVIDAGGKDLAIYVVHTEAYDTDGTKTRQLEELKALLEEETLTWLVGGDFNALPPTAVRLSGFNDDSPDALGTEFETPPYLLTELQPYFADYLSAISLTQLGTTEAEQRDFYTHSIIGPERVGTQGEPGFWTRTLDYLFVETPSNWVPGTTEVLQTPGRSGILSNPLLLSDHCPVIGTWEFVR
ncbi:MAG: endonuclease/exonuclease/phosphatase family protein [Myxococcota bacterium]|nr:endonuclease/exonuclease/phosphatase family protein [Myxococcota bacterium]